jgi:uncharacterized protein (DUF983 family)
MKLALSKQGKEKGPIQKAIDEDKCPKCKCFVDYTMDSPKCESCGLVIMGATKSQDRL